MNEKYPLMSVKLQGNLIDQVGVNIYHLGRFLQSSQELMNVSAIHEVKREIPFEKYTSQPHSLEQHFRRLFIQGHIEKATQGSFDILVNLVAQPDLRAFFLSDNFKSFAISVLANMFTSIGFILFEKRRRNKECNSDYKDQSLAINLAPHLEKIARCITPRGGIERIEFKAEETNSTSNVHFIVDRGSREKILDFVETVQPQKISIAGEIRSLDLDQGVAIIADAISGERYELKESESVRFDKDLLGQHVYVKGRIYSVVNRHGGVGTKIEIGSITPLEKIGK